MNFPKSNLFVTTLIYKVEISNSKSDLQDRYTSILDMPLFMLRIALESTFIYKVMKLYYQNTKRYYRAFSAMFI